VEVVVQDTGGKEQIVKTTGQGYYEFRGLRTGTYRVKVNETGTAQAFRYILTSNSSSLPIKQGISVQVTKDTPLSLPLAQGLFVSPACGQIMGWFDHASATGSVMNHIGDGTRFQTPSKPFVSISEVKAGTYDQHFGIDFYGDEGTPVVAVAPGTVMTTRTADNGALEVRINHGQADFAPGFEMHSFYGHLLDFAVKPGQKVERGQLIGHVGVSGASWYHLHFYVVLNGRKDSEDLFVYIDPFGITFKSQQDESDMVRPDGGRPEHRVMSYRQVSLWTVYNDPQCTVGK
jgi:murein DD-endopeptidase MepM/ murein hydrolase activator NlpD